MRGSEWTVEGIACGEAHCHRIRRRIHTERTRFQTIEILETEGYGVGLFLDGRIQHVEADEYIFSEVMTHPAVTLLGGTGRRALVRSSKAFSLYLLGFIRAYAELLPYKATFSY